MRKPAAWILTVIVSLLIVQPGFIHFGGKAAYGSTGSCTMMKAKAEKTGCAKTKCGKTKAVKEKPVKEKKRCGADHCNPFLCCAAGNFYIHNYCVISLDILSISKDALSPANDNTLAKRMTEC